MLRALVESGRNDLQVVAINDLTPIGTLTYLFEFDSVHDHFGSLVDTGKDWIDLGTGHIRVTSEKEPDKLPWGDVDIALECTGLCRSVDAAGLHLRNGSV